jgi:hypothetical protein
MMGSGRMKRKSATIVVTMLVIVLTGGAAGAFMLFESPLSSFFNVETTFDSTGPEKTWTIANDTTPPEIYLHPENMTVLKNSGTITLKWAVRDDVSTYGGYFIDFKMPEISSMWFTMKTYLWYSEQTISFSLDTSEVAVYFIRFRAHDEALNFAEHIIRVSVVPEIDPPEISHSSEVTDSGFAVHYTISDATGISTIIISSTTDGSEWENLTSHVAEPKNNKEINGLVGLAPDIVGYRIFAEDYYGTWSDTGEVFLMDSTTSSTATIPDDSITGDNLQPDYVLPLAIGLATSSVVVLVGIIVLRRRAQPFAH